MPSSEQLHYLHKFEHDQTLWFQKYSINHYQIGFIHQAAIEDTFTYAEAVTQAQANPNTAQQPKPMDQAATTDTTAIRS